jgi:hypothetical protein
MRAEEEIEGLRAEKEEFQLWLEELDREIDELKVGYFLRTVRSIFCGLSQQGTVLGGMRCLAGCSFWASCFSSHAVVLCQRRRHTACDFLFGPKIRTCEGLTVF